MKTKGLSKLLSVILTVAICLTTVLGCLITVNAADSNCTYAIECVQTKRDYTTAKFTVKFDYSDGFTAGQFAVNESKNTASNGNTYSINSVTNVAVVSGTAKSGNFSATDFNLTYGADSGENDVQLEFITFEVAGEKLYSSVTFEVTVKFDGTFYPGATYPISLSDVELADLHSILTPTDASVAGHNNFHAHCAGSVANYLQKTENPMDVVETDTENGYTLYKTSDSAPIKCSVCGEIFDYQLLPDGAFTYLNNYTELYGVNIQYNNDGTFNLNVYAPNMANFSLYVTKTNGQFVSKITELSDVPASVAASLPSGTKCFKIENLSAGDIDTTFLLTPVRININKDDVDVTEILWATTQQISIADYAEKVISGDAVYTEGATTDQIEADKKVAAAIVLYGETAKEALGTSYNGGTTTGRTDVFDDANMKSPADTKHNGTSWDDAIILTTIAELYYEIKVGNTEGKYYKLDPEITAVDMQAVPNITLESTAEDIKNATTKLVNVRNVTAATFKGSFDAGGAVFYNAYVDSTDNNSVAAGLFCQVTSPDKTTNNSNTIKNLIIQNSYFTGYSAGAIAGMNSNEGESKVIFENCIVKNCLIESIATDGTIGGAGIIMGNCKWRGADIDNCFAINNTLVASNGGALGGFVATSANGYSLTPSYKNSVSIGTSPISTKYNSNNTNFVKPSYFTGVYTDQTVEDGYSGKITTLDIYQMQGSAAKANMPNLDWDSTWVYGTAGEYPTFASPDYVEPATKTDTQKVVYLTMDKNDNWGEDSSYLNSEGRDGSAEHPYLISTPAHLRHLAKNSTYQGTVGKYFEIDPTIKTIVFQEEKYVNDVLGGLDTFLTKDAETVKTLLSTAEDRVNFATSGGKFSGHLNGNGVEFVGLYTDQGGLFCEIGNEASLEGITLENCYVSSGDYAGVLFGKTRATNNGEIANISTITISDCYVESTTQNAERVGVLYGTIFEPWQSDTTSIKHTGVKISNIFVHDNIAYYNINNTPTAAGVVGGANNNFSGLNKDTEPNNVEFSNSIILDCAPYSLATDNQGSRAEWFSNIYTNYDFSIMPSAVRNNFGYTWKNYADKIIQINLSDIKGSKALTTMPALDWNTADNTDGVWYTGNKYSYPALEPATTSLPDYAQSEYDAMTFTSLDNYGDSTSDWGLYATSLNVKTNPYMAFTFAFKGINAENAENVTVTLTTESGKTYTETANNMVNNQGAGKYYLWRAKTIPVYELCGKLKLSATYNGETKNFGTVSLEGFILDLENANRADPCTYYTTRTDVAKAVMFYAKMLNERYGTTQQ